MHLSELTLYLSCDNGNVSSLCSCVVTLVWSCDMFFDVCVPFTCDDHHVSSGCVYMLRLY